MLSLKTLQKLSQKKYRQESGLFVVEGKRGVLDALQAEADIRAVVMSESFQRSLDSVLAQELGGKRAQLVQVIDDGSFAKLSDTTTPQGILAVCTIPEYSLSDFYGYKKVAVLEDIRDPGNLGTMIRTADWFGLDGILLLKGADPYQPKVVRSSMGSLFHVPILSLPNIESIAEFQKRGFSLIVTRPESNTTTVSPNIQPPLLVAFGSEAHGTSDQLDTLADASISIPKHGAAESLNVAVSFGIIWHELLRSPRLT